MTSDTLLDDLLFRLGACPAARDWAATQPGLAAAWDACERADWMIWLATTLGVDRRLVTRAACAIARTALVHVPEDERRPLLAIETAEAWMRGEATLDEVHDAACVSLEAANDADTRDCWAAAICALRAARAADGEDIAYAVASHVAEIAASSSCLASSSSDAARAASLRSSAGLVREVISADMICAAAEHKGRAT